MRSQYSIWNTWLIFEERTKIHVSSLRLMDCNVICTSFGFSTIFAIYASFYAHAYLLPPLFVWFCIWFQHCIHIWRAYTEPCLYLAQDRRFKYDLIKYLIRKMSTDLLCTCLLMSFFRCVLNFLCSGRSWLGISICRSACLTYLFKKSTGIQHREVAACWSWEKEDQARVWA